MEIIKIGRVELTEEGVQKLYEEKKYICTFSAIYQIHYSQAQQKFYGSKLYSIGLAGRGRYYALTAKEINDICKKTLLREDIY